MKATLREAGDRLSRIADRMRRELIEAENENLELARKTAYRFSSGIYTYERLRELGHPYAPGRTPPRDPAVINVQSGEFPAAWVAQFPRNENGTLVSRLSNFSWKAPLLEYGTKRMVPRPLPELVVKTIRLRRERRIEQALKRALRG